MPAAATELVYGPFRVDRTRLLLACGLMAVALAVLPLCDSRTDIHCEQRGPGSALCVLQPEPFSPRSASFTLQALETTREARRVGRHHTHWFGQVRLLDAAGKAHDSLLVPHERAQAATQSLRDFVAYAEAGEVFEERLSAAHGQLVLAPLLAGIALWLAVHALRGSGRIKLRIDARGRLRVTRFFCGLPVWRRACDVRQARAVEIQWCSSITPRSETLARSNSRGDAPGTDRSFARLWLRTATDETHIPGSFMRGRQVHADGAAALRDLLGLPALVDVLPAQELPTRGERLQTSLAVAALGAVVGLLAGLLASRVSGVETESEHGALALYAVGACLGAAVGLALGSRARKV